MAKGTRLLGVVFFALLTYAAVSCQQRSDSDALQIQYLEIWAPALNETFEALALEWASVQGQRVEFTRVPLAELPQRVAEFVEVEGAATLAVIPATQAVIHRDVLLPMDEVVGELENDGHQALPIVKAMNFSHEKWVAAPLYSWSHIWVWRGDLLAQSGLELPRTLPEAKFAMSRLNSAVDKVHGFGIGLGNDDDARMFTQSILWSFGGSVFDENADIVLDSPETREAYAFILSLHQENLLPPGVLGWDGASNNRAFLAGTIAGTANSPTILYAAKREDAVLAEHIEHSLYPKGPAGRHTFATGFSLAIRRDNPRAEEAKDLVRHLLQERNYSRLISAGEGSVNPQYSGFEGLEVWDDPRLRVGLDSMEFEHPVGWPGPVTLSAAEVFERHVLTDVFGRVLNDGWSLDSALAEAVRRVEQIVQRNRASESQAGD